MLTLSYSDRGASTQVYCRPYWCLRYARAVLACEAKKVYISNLATQAGETYRYTASEHVQALYDHAGEAFIDAVLLNGADLSISPESEGMTGPPWPVENDIEMLQQLVPYVVVKDIGIRLEGSLMHDSGKGRGMAHGIYGKCDKNGTDVIVAEKGGRIMSFASEVKKELTQIEGGRLLYKSGSCGIH